VHRFYLLRGVCTKFIYYAEFIYCTKFIYCTEFILLVCVECLHKRLVGSLMYLIAARPDIMFVVSLISRFMETSKSTHWQARKRILRYVAGTTDFGI
jgi:hypothetical protein